MAISSDALFTCLLFKVMQVLQEAMPEGVRPYTIISSHPIPEVLTAMTFCGDHYLAGGSKDNHVS